MRHHYEVCNVCVKTCLILRTTLWEPAANPCSYGHVVREVEHLSLPSGNQRTKRRRSLKRIIKFKYLEKKHYRPDDRCTALTRQSGIGNPRPWASRSEPTAAQKAGGEAARSPTDWNELLPLKPAVPRQKDRKQKLWKPKGRLDR